MLNDPARTTNPVCSSSSKILIPSELLSIVNQIAGRFRLGHFNQLPQVSAQVRQCLFNIPITVVDDSEGWLVELAAHLVIATNNNLSVIHHLVQGRDELIDQIVASRPRILLLDYNLQWRITGADLIPDLKQRLPDCCIIAHSEFKGNNALMMAAGAHGQVEKYAGGNGLTEIVSIFEKFITKQQ